MYEALAWSLHLVRKQTLSLVEDLTGDQWFLQSFQGEQYPAWILGHLLLSDSYLLHLLDSDDLPEDFGELLQTYGPESELSGRASVGIPPGVLTQRLQETGSRRFDVVSGFTGVDFDKATPDSRLVTNQPTIGHHLQALVYHEGYHGGGLAAWRRHHNFQSKHWVFTPSADSSS